jgi:hypothetical protein
MLLTVEFPLEPFNSIVRSGKVGEIIGRILELVEKYPGYKDAEMILEDMSSKKTKP